MADALARPALVRIDDNLFVLRFECMKVASALGAVESLLEDGTVTPGQTLVDSSSGVYALALALACAKYELRCHIVASPIVDSVLKTQLEILGATVEQPSGGGDACLDQASRVERVKEFVARTPGSFWMRQYHDRRHYAGYTRIAEEMVRQLGTDQLTLVGGVGSGASTAGLSRAAERVGVDVRLVGVQPFGSVSFSSQHVEDPDFLIAGLGSGIHFGNIDYDAYDDVHWLNFTVARTGSIELLREHGLFAGLSSGAAYTVARWAAREAEQPTVFIAADTGHRYLGRVFQDGADLPPLPSTITPIEVTRPEELQLPWSRTAWQRHRAMFPVPQARE